MKLINLIAFSLLLVCSAAHAQKPAPKMTQITEAAPITGQPDKVASQEFDSAREFEPENRSQKNQHPLFAPGQWLVRCRDEAFGPTSFNEAEAMLSQWARGNKEQATRAAGISREENAPASYGAFSYAVTMALPMRNAWRAGAECGARSCETRLYGPKFPTLPRPQACGRIPSGQYPRFKHCPPRA